MEKVLDNINFFSRAKLMPTGEYLVLHGAESLSLPLKPGQKLEVKSSKGLSSIQWKTYEKSQFWFDAHFSLPEFAIGNTNDFLVAKNLRDILLAAKELNPDFLKEGIHYMVKTDLEFEFKWGFGSSSSLIANIGKWAEVDPFILNTRISKGSGYDIAAALSDAPILYSLKEDGPVVEKVKFDPVFKEKLYFVYLGEKKNSEKEIINFMENKAGFTDEINKINRITRDIIKTENIIDFTKLMQEHESIISGILKMPQIKKKRFSDFNGFVKSLGAWGGDFALFMSDYPVDYVSSYLKRKSLNTWFHYKDLVIPNNTSVNV